jgi:hypothetical protein
MNYEFNYKEINKKKTEPENNEEKREQISLSVVKKRKSRGRQIQKIDPNNLDIVATVYDSTETKILNVINSKDALMRYLEIGEYKMMNIK